MTGTSVSINSAMNVAPLFLNNKGAAISDCTISPALPAGLSIDPSTCVIWGNPSEQLVLTSFTVTAENSAGQSAASVSLEVLGYGPPNNVFGLVMVGRTFSSVSLGWMSGGGTTVGYRVSYQSGATAPTNCSSGTQISEGDISGTGHIISGLASNTQYSFRVCAINGNGTPDVSSGLTITASTLQGAPPNPTNLLVVTKTGTSVSLDWDSGGGTTVGYRISYQAGLSTPGNCSGGTQISEGDITGTSHMISGLTPLTTYIFRVCAINGNGTPDVSSGASVLTSTLQAAPPDPTNFLALTTTATSVSLDWDSGGGSTVGYRIGYQSGATAPTNCSSGIQISEGDISGTGHIISGLASNTQYSFRVCAINGNGTPDVSSGLTITASTLQAVPPDPTNFLALVTTTTSVSLDWEDAGGTTSGFRISYQSGATAPANCSSGTQISESSITGTRHTISGLGAGGQYSFRLCSVDASSGVSSGVTTTVTLKKPMISEWQISSNGDSITLPLRDGFSYNAVVDWGDGTPYSLVTSPTDPDKVHVYATAGTYTIKISGLMVT